MFTTVRNRNILLFRADPLRPHKGKLQPDGLELENLEIEVLSGSSFLWLRNIVRVFNQDTSAASATCQLCGLWGNELGNLRVPRSALDLRQVVQRQQEVFIGFNGQSLQQDRAVLDEQYTVGWIIFVGYYFIKLGFTRLRRLTILRRLGLLAAMRQPKLPSG